MDTFSVNGKTLLDVFDTPILICDYGGYIKYINPEISTCFQWTVDDLIGNNINIIVPENVIENRNKNNISYEILSKDGTIKIYNVKIIDCKSESILVIKFNTSDEVMSNVLLKKQKEEADQYYKLLCSDVHVSLQNITSSVDMIKLENLTEVQNYLLDGINAIVRNINTITKYNVDDTCIPFKFKELIESQLSVFKSIIVSKNINVNVNVNNCDIYINHKFNSFVKIFENIISNSVKYTNFGSITINLSIIDNRIDVSVIDTGIGMSDEKLANIYLSENKHLGIYETIKTIKQLGGTFLIESKSNIGTNFKFNIPLIESTNLGTSIKITNTHIHKNISSKVLPSLVTKEERSKYKILIVDDTTVIVKMLKLALKSLGYSCGAVNDGIYVMDELLKDNYDLVLLDYSMPILNGYETAKEIRNSTIIKQPFIVMLSGDKVSFNDISIDHYLLKPIDKLVLCDILDMYLIEK